MAESPTRIGAYPIERELGRGGMGIVYLARDVRLQRAVAIKVLPEGFARDPERLSRFEREARLLASLNHPNIAAIYGLEEADGQRFLVLEYVEGETLAERIERGRVPLDETLSIGRQIAAALEAAHESGVIHRDLKPGNVKITPAGDVKVLDFGLAKGAGSADSSPDFTQSPTIAYAPTGAGVILGTAAYMSPEQARGKVVDRRTDIWSFGCVLYECLTGRQLFHGETVSDMIAKILEREPDWNVLPADTPPRVRELLRRCLEKDAKQRLRDIGEARIELAEAQGARTSSTRVAVAPAPVTLRRGPGLGIAWLVAAASLALAATATLAPLAFKRPDRAVRFPVTAEPGTVVFEDPTECAISPDGRMVVFSASDSAGNSQLWLRSLDALAARALPGTDNAAMPFWSANSKSIGFFADGKLKKVTVASGSIETLCEAKNGRGGTWNHRDVIVFAPDGAGALYRVAGSGGEPQRVTTLDSTRRQSAHRFPSFLPDGKRFLFASLPARSGKYDIWIGGLDGSKPDSVMSASASPIFVPPGYLAYLRGQSLVAQKFDYKNRRLLGPVIPLPDVPGVSGSSSYRPASVSDAGDLAYLNSRLRNTQLTYLDRSGRPIGTVQAPPGRYEQSFLSPDGRFAAVVKVDSPAASDIWIIDLQRSTSTRFTHGSRNDFPTWSPDSRRIIFESNRNGPGDFFIRPVNGSTPETTFHASSIAVKNPFDWSADGRFLTFEQLDPQTGWDLYLAPIDGGGKATPYLRTPYNERWGTISPDGRWMAYSSDESGTFEIYVQSFPEPGDKYRVSTAGGVVPQWRADGREILFLSLDFQTVLSCDVASSPTFRAAAARLLYRLPRGSQIGTFTPDFQRQLVPIPAGESAPSTITVALNWVSELKKR
ncbi:MAG TPA: protein kinase [Candidatus Eisenbacteria bacterium]|nr:protein kinase [Candidatus Eisenbacteria bacterium]